MSLTPAQRHQAMGLYRRVMRTARETFNDDAATVAAWRSKVRSEWKVAARETDSAKFQESVKTWEDVIKILRQNIVQGVYSQEREAYQLRFKPETELGTNESIKAGREQQLEQLRKSKGSLRCGGASAQAGPSSGSARAFSTSAWHAARSKNSKAEDADLANAAIAMSPGLLPRPPAHFDQITLLSDGSSIRLTTTSPRSVNRLTRDPTNHPLWNPSMERGQGSVEEDESGRVARFRKRFAGSSGDASSSTAQAQEAGADMAEEASDRAAQQQGGVSFSSDDYDWMSVGGREARASSRPAAPQKGGGKGKK